MASQNSIWSCARDDLVVLDDQGHADVFLWEHASRVARTAEWIAEQPDVPQDRVDLSVLLAASLYDGAGWAVQLREGVVCRTDLLGKAATDVQRDLAASLMEKRLAKLMPGGVLQRAAECIRTSHPRHSDLVEAQILADADNLDQIGPLLLCQIVRRQGLEGGGVQAAIDTWNRRKEYRYWDARIDAFCFESARKVAHQRLKEIDRYMTELGRQHLGQDLVPAVSETGAREPAK